MSGAPSGSFESKEFWLLPSLVGLAAAGIQFFEFGAVGTTVIALVLILVSLACGWRLVLTARASAKALGDELASLQNQDTKKQGQDQ